MLETPKSSWIRGFEIDTENRTVRAVLRSGDVLEATDSPAWMAGLLASYVKRTGSGGKAFHRLLKPRLDVAKIQQPAPPDDPEELARALRASLKAKGKR